MRPKLNADGAQSTTTREKHTHALKNAAKEKTVRPDHRKLSPQMACYRILYMPAQTAAGTCHHRCYHPRTTCCCTLLPPHHRKLPPPPLRPPLPPPPPPQGATSASRRSAIVLPRRNSRTTYRRLISCVVLYRRCSRTPPSIMGSRSHGHDSLGFVRRLSPCLLYTSPSPRD